MSPLACSTLNIVAALITAGAALATQEEFRLQRLNGAIKLDGHSDEPAWQAIAPVPLTMRQPTFDGMPTERTEIRLAYDDDFLYASGRFYDSDPYGKLPARKLRRAGSPKCACHFPASAFKIATGEQSSG